MFLKIIKFDSDFKLFSSEDNCNIQKAAPVGVNSAIAQFCVPRALTKNVILISTCLRVDLTILA